jgi:O-methyltransferase
MMKRAIQRVARQLGYEVFARDAALPVALREQTVGELEALYRQFLFPGLPERQGRAAQLARLEGTSAGEALHLVEYLHRSLSVAGAVCEFGVAQGATSALLASEIVHTDRQLWLFDSFQGLGRPGPKDVLIDDIFGLGAIERYEGKMAVGQPEVLRRLRQVGFPAERTRVVPGFVEESLRRPGLPAAVAFAYVDFDFYQPILLALQFLDRTTAPGARVVVDDYGFFSAGAQAAVDEFLAGRPQAWERLPALPSAGHFAVLSRKA